MKLLARHINFSPVRANSVRMLLCSALPPRQDLIGLNDDQYVQIMMKAVIDGSRY
jgi:hypothetical protein